MPETSILDDVKSTVNVGEDDNSFDKELIDFINTEFMALSQMGIGPDTKDCFQITGPNEKWSDFEPTKKYFAPVKTIIGLKVRLNFDPPANGTISQTFNEQINECIERLRLECELENAENN